MRGVTARAAHRRRGPRGQSLTELALVAPVLLALLAGTSQVGLIYYDQVTLDTAVREGARVAADNPASTALFSNGAPVASPTLTCTTASSNLACKAIYASTQKGIFGGLIDTSKLQNVTITAGSASAAGYTSASPGTCFGGATASANDGTMTVHAEYRAPVFVPLIGSLFADSSAVSYRTLKANVTIRVSPCTVNTGN